MLRKRRKRAPRARRPRLSQHLLRDGHVAGRIVGFAGVLPGERVLEIGPGRGALTRPLLEAGARVLAIEADRKLADALLRELDDDDLKVMVTDATRAPWPPADKIVSNLPYHVTTPLVLRALEAPVKLSVLTVQKEYADRMVARAGEDGYSRLSVAVACRAECELLETIPPGAFSPPPRVHSAVVRLTPRPFPFRTKSHHLFFQVVRTLFSQRRKKVGSVIRGTAGLRRVPHADSRPEQLTPEQLGEVADAVFDDVEEEAGELLGRSGPRKTAAAEEEECAPGCDCLL